MNVREKERMMQEARMQLNALKTIKFWKVLAVALSTLGVALTYAGMAGEHHYIFLGILGIILIITGIVAALIFNLGLKNGRRNVEKILNLIG